MTEAADTEDRWVCGNGHSNSAGMAACGACGAFPPPGSQAPSGPAPCHSTTPQEEPLSQALYQEASKFTGYANIFTILTLLGAIGIGYVASQETSCNLFGSVPSCETTQDGATFAIVTLSAFVGGMLFVLPLRSASSILTGVARLLDHEERAGP